MDGATEPGATAGPPFWIDSARLTAECSSLKVEHIYDISNSEVRYCFNSNISNFQTPQYYNNWQIVLQFHYNF